MQQAKIVSGMQAAVVGFAVLCALAFAPAAAAQADSTAQDEASLRRLLNNYANSIDTLNLQLAGQVWSHGHGVSFIQPRGTDEGFDQIIHDFYEGAMATFSQRELILHNPVIHIYGDAAWSEMTWTFHATVKNGGPHITTTGRETQIYHKENGIWRIVHIHYSGPPVTGKLKGF